MNAKMMKNQNFYEIRDMKVKEMLLNLFFFKTAK